MKKFKISNSVIIVIVISLIFIFITTFNNVREFDTNKKAYNNWVEKCNNEIESSSFCEEYTKWEGPVRTDAFFTTFDLINDDYFSIFLYIYPLLILLMSLESINKKLNSQYIKNEMLREDYSKIIKKEWMSSLKYTLFIPTILLVLFVISYILTGSINYKYSLEIIDPWVNTIFFKNLYSSIIIYFMNFMIHSIFIINIGFCVSKKSRNYLLSVISSYLVYLGVWVMSEFFFGFILSTSIGKQSLHNYFSFGNIWNYSEINNFLAYLLIITSYTLISCMISFLFYKNKESVLIANE